MVSYVSIGNYYDATSSNRWLYAVHGCSHSDSLYLSLVIDRTTSGGASFGKNSGLCVEPSRCRDSKRGQ